MTAKISFWEELLGMVYADEAMTILEAHQRDSLYGFYLEICDDDAARGRVMAYNVTELPPVIFVRCPDPEADEVRSSLKAEVRDGKLHPAVAARRYYDAIIQRVVST